MEMRSKPWIPAVVVLIISSFFASSAMSDAPKFHRAVSSMDGASLVVSWDERGLGNGDIDYTLTADANATYACFNGGGKHPQAANKETVNAKVSASGSFESKNGRVQASLKTGPPGPGGFSCPKGQELRLAAVSYANIVLTDTTNGVSVSVDGQAVTLIAL